MIRHILEAGLLKLLFAAFRILPLDTASRAGGFIARAVGPCFKAHRTAAKNLAMVFPEKTEKERRRILNGMWDNLGRVAGEFSHLPAEELIRRVEVSGIEHLPMDRPAIFISGHFGNWELTYPVPHAHGIKTALVYRHLNNPYADAIIARLRATRSTAMLAKGPRGAVKLARAIKDGLSLAMLVDQKMNEGVAVPFFGNPAMTAPAVAQLALRYDMPIVPARIVRTGGCHFKGTAYPPLAFEKTGDDEKDVLAILTAINKTLEGWIRETPEQWFWVHKRWPNTSS